MGPGTPIALLGSMTSRLILAVGADDHVQGAFDAPATLVEYGDFECSYCGAAYPIVKAVVRELGTKLRFVFRNFPLLDLHPHAALAAEAAEAAGAQGGFWEMHDLLFENQGDLSARALVRYANRAVRDPARWALDVQRHAFAARVRDDFTSGLESGVQGTPTFYINGSRHDGAADAESLLSALVQSMNRDDRERTQPGPRARHRSVRNWS
jgi:protein-disulfide isomerase